MNSNKVAKAVKQYLIDLSINDELPLDLNDLSIVDLDKVINDNHDDYIDKAGGLLCDGEDSIEVQIELIAHQSKINGSVMIDYVDRVIVWEKVEHSFTCDAFLEYIDYIEK